MTITMEIPEELAERLGGPSPAELSKQALEALVLEAYRKERVGGAEAAGMLHFSRVEWEQFLEEHRVLEDAYTIEDLERDVDTQKRLRTEGALPEIA